MELDAERLAQYPATVSDGQNWKVWQDGTIPVAQGEIQIPNMGDMMAMICGDAVKEVAGLCVGAWVYLLNERIDASSYDSNMNSRRGDQVPQPRVGPMAPTPLPASSHRNADAAIRPVGRDHGVVPRCS